LDKVVILGTQSTTKLGLLCLDFFAILNRFYKFLPKHNKGEAFFYWKPPWKFLNLQTYAIAFPSLGTDGNGELAGGEERRGRQTSEGDMQLGSPRSDWRW
jgi:hypothetical protein